MAGTTPPSDNRVGFSVYAGLEERAQDPELKKVLSRLRKVTAADVARLAPEIRNPLLSSVNFYIPAERSILNQWIRYYDRFHPLVGNAIDLHSELPLSRFGLKGLADTSKLNFYMEMVEEMDLYIFMLDMAREYFLLGECLRPGSLVSVGDGLERRIDSLSAGDKVLTHTGKLSSVQYVMHRNYTGNMYSITVRGLPHTPLSCTDNHPLLVAKKEDWKCPSGLVRFCNSGLSDRCQQKKSPKFFNMCSEEKFSSISRNIGFVEAKDVKEGDYVVGAFDETATDIPELTLGVCKLFGYYLSEGCVSYNNDRTVRTGVNVANTAKDVVEEVAVLFSEEFDIPRLGVGTLKKRLGRGVEEWVKVDSSGMCHHVKVKSKRVADLFSKHCGELSHTKRVSREVMELPATKQLEVLKRFCVGDGWVDNGRVTMGSASKDLVTQMYSMSLRVGMVPSYFHRVLPPSGLSSVKSPCDMWFLKYSGNDSVRFYEYFNKLSHVSTKYSKVVRSSFIKGNQVFRKVQKVISAPYDGIVYNLSVAGDNSFVVNGLATHNCVPYLVWDDEFNCFTRAELINPDYIDVRGHPLVTSGGESYRYELIPDQTIRDFLNSEHPDDKELRRNMDSDLVSAVRAGRNIRLDNFLVSMVARKQHRYEPRGTSVVLRCLKDLMYEDKLREAQYAISEGHITPKQVWKIGDKDHQPLGGDLRKFRDLLLEAQNDPIFSLVCHYAVSAEFIGSAGKILPLLPEFEFIYNRILTGLFMNKSMVGSEGPSYANASVASRMLMARYITLRGKLEQWALRKVFAPVAAANEFYKRSKAEIDHHVYPTPDRQEMAEDVQSVGQEGYETKVLDLPQFDWRSKSNLLDDTLVKQLLLQLHQRTALPMRVLCEALEIDYRMAETWLKREEGTVFDPLYQEIRKRRAEFALGVQMRGPNVPGQRPGGGGMMELGLGAEGMPPGGAGAGAPAGTPPGGPPGTAAGPAGIPGRPAPPVPGSVAPTLGPGGGMAPPPATPGMGMGMAPASLGEPKPVFSSEDEVAKKICSLVEEKKKVEEELELESRAGLGTLEVKRLSKRLTKDTVNKSLEKAKESSAGLASMAEAADKVQDSTFKKNMSGFPFRSRELNMDVLKESSFLEELKKREQEGEDA